MGYVSQQSAREREISNLLSYKAILGALQSRDGGRKRIHASDFKRAVEQLGFKFGQTLLDDVIVKCSIDSEGFLNITRLQEDIDRLEQLQYYEENLDNENKNKDKKFFAVKIGAPIGAVKRTGVHVRQLEAQEQSRLVRSKLDEISTIFRQYADCLISQDEFYDGLLAIGLKDTFDLRHLVRRAQWGELQLSDFIRSLTRLDSVVDTDVAAGSSQRTKDADTLINSLGRMRRKDPTRNRTSDTLEKIANKPQLGKPQAKGKCDPYFWKSDQMKEFLKPETHEAPIQSWAHYSMLKGLNESVTDLASSETKLLRQQIMAFARKMECGQISGLQFVEAMLELGIEIPENILKMTTHFEQTGHIDMVAFLRAFEIFFDRDSAERKVSKEEAIDLLLVFKQDLQSKGHTSLQKLVSIFKRIVDSDAATLTFSEFKKGFGMLDVGLTDAEIKKIYNYFDRGGGGIIDLSEFLDELRGPFSQDRLKMVKSAFHKLDKTGAGMLTPEDVINGYISTNHPDVRSGKITCHDAENDFLGTFDIYFLNDNVITLDEFIKYYRNISFLIDSDTYFKDLLKSTWNLGDLPAPPPSHVTVRGQQKPAPIGAISHGNIISWHQEPSRLELMGAMKEKRKTYARDFQTSLNLHSWIKPGASVERDGLFDTRKKFDHINSKIFQKSNKIEFKQQNDMKHGSQPRVPSEQRHEIMQRKFPRHPQEPVQKTWTSIHKVLQGDCIPPYGVSAEYKDIRQIVRQKEEKQGKMVSLAEVLAQKM